MRIAFVVVVAASLSATHGEAGIISTWSAHGGGTYEFEPDIPAYGFSARDGGVTLDYDVVTSDGTIELSMPLEGFDIVGRVLSFDAGPDVAIVRATYGYGGDILLAIGGDPADPTRPMDGNPISIAVAPQLMGDHFSFQGTTVPEPTGPLMGALGVLWVAWTARSRRPVRA